MKYDELTEKIIKSLEEDLEQSVKELARKLNVNRISLFDYLTASENHGYIRSKRIDSARVYSICNKAGELKYGS